MILSAVPHVPTIANPSSLLVLSAHYPPSSSTLVVLGSAEKNYSLSRDGLRDKRVYREENVPLYPVNVFFFFFFFCLLILFFYCHDCFAVAVVVIFIVVVVVAVDVVMFLLLLLLFFFIIITI